MPKKDKEINSKNLADESKYEEDIADFVKKKNKQIRSKQVINK